MKYLCLAIILAMLLPHVRAAYGENGHDNSDSSDQDQQEQQKPPEEIPDFSGLNEYIYQPKTTLNFGFRLLSGVKSSFSGNGYIPAPETLGDPTVVQEETYHDGQVGTDTRTIVNDNGNGTSTAVLAASDGKTNSWTYDNASQYVDGLMTFNVYSATMPDLSGFKAQGPRNSGMEVSVAHDMSDLTKRLSWKIFFGMSLNDIQSATFATVKDNLTTTTDIYDLYGQTPMPAGTSSPSSENINVVDANGNQVLDPTTGDPVTQSVDTTVLISAVPLARQTNTVADFGTVVDHWKEHGAYTTWRAGPQLVYQLTDHLKLSFSVGPALIYAGSMFNVTEVMTPPTGAPIIDTLVDTTQKLVPAAYADLTMQYDLNDRAGFYLGAVYQDGGSYVQTADDTMYGVYHAKVDFSDQNGLRGGLTFKF